MAREPSYPEDVPVDPPAGAAGADEKKPGAARTKHLVTGAAIGIGSAALVAALLYANRSRNKPDKT
jgi:hypothetical protein